MPFIERGLGVKCIHLRGPAIGENVNDMLRLAKLLRRSYGQRIGSMGGFLKNRAQGQRPQAHAAAIQEIAAREKKV